MNDKFLQLVDILKLKKNVYIQSHNIPDPDSIASCYGLWQLLSIYKIDSTICYYNTIEKANSKKMLELFDINMKQITEKNVDSDFVIIIDTQVGHSNIPVVVGNEIGVIDHHENNHPYDYIVSDIRTDIGACSTIIAQYYFGSGIKPPTNIATSLLYGIMTDTDNLTRGVNALDAEMFYWLYNQADINNIKLLKLNQLGKEDLVAYAKALTGIEVYEYLGFVHVENCNDSLLGTISDLVTTVEGVTVVVAYATRREGVKFSIRSGHPIIKANELIRYIINGKGVGGGHQEMAGGFILAEKLGLNNKGIDTYVRHRAISYVESVDNDF